MAIGKRVNQTKEKKLKKKNKKSTVKKTGKVQQRFKEKNIFTGEQVIELLSQYALEENPQSNIETERQLAKDWLKNVAPTLGIRG